MTGKILLIEDDVDTRELYEEVLRDAGYQLVLAEDGEAGLAHAREGGFDLILLDMMLPKMDGLGVLRGLVNEPPKVPNKKIILLTNLSHDQVIKIAMGLGVADYLIKSDIDPGQMLEKVKGYLA